MSPAKPQGGGQRRARRPRGVPLKPAGSVATQTAPATAPAVSARLARLIGIALFAALLVIYLTNLHYESSVDNVSTALLPFSIAREGNLDLDEFRALLGADGGPGYTRERHGHLYSANTVVTPLLVAPLYVLPAHWLATHGVPYDDVRAQLLIVVMERLSAALLIALSASVMWFALRRVTTDPWALAITLVYALGTNTWTTSSQGLWTHTLSELCLAGLCAIFLAPAPSRIRLALAGTLAALATANRPQMLIFAILALVFVWQRRRRDVVAFVVTPMIAAVALLVYNLRVLRSAIGAYGPPHFSTSILTGLAGLLISPNRGLLPFTPVMVFAAWGAYRVWRDPSPPWLRYLTVGIGLQLLLYAKFDVWWGGYAYGPRYLTDVLPALCLLLAYALRPLNGWRPLTVLAAVLAVFGVLVQAVGVYGDPDNWNRGPVPLQSQPDRVWDWSDLQIIRTARSGWHGGALVPLITQALCGAPPARLEPLTVEDLASEIRVADAPSRLSPGSSREVTVEVVNRGSRSWPVFRAEMRVRYRVFLFIRWLHDGEDVPGVGDIVDYPRNVTPGERITLRAPLVAPHVPGDYEVEIGVTQALDGSKGVAGANRYRFALHVE